MKKRLVFLNLLSLVALFFCNICYKIRLCSGGAQAGITAQTIYAADTVWTGQIKESKNIQGTDSNTNLTIRSLYNSCEAGFLPYGKLYNGSMEFQYIERPPLSLIQYTDTSFKPATLLGGYSVSNRLGFSRTDALVYKSRVFIPLFGELAPTQGEVLVSSGYEALQMDINAILYNDLNAKKYMNGAPTWLKKGRFEQPIVSRLNPSGDPDFIVYFGIKKSGKYGSSSLPKTGVVWKMANIKNKR